MALRFLNVRLKPDATHSVGATYWTDVRLKPDATCCTWISAIAVAACVALMCGACGGSMPSSPSPAIGTTGGNTGGTTGTTTFTITSSGVSPKSLTVAAGTQVTFVNNDSQPHDMASDPHPLHTDCPEINSVGFLTPGQSRTTAAMRTVRPCGFHDHNQPSNATLQGTIVVQ